MKCTNCGNEISEDAKFCKWCGAPVRASSAKNKQWKDQYTLLVIAGAMLLAGAAGFAIKKIHASESDAATQTVISGQQDNMLSEETIENTPEDNDMDSFEESTEKETEQVYDETESGIHRYGYFIDDCTWSEAFHKARQKGGYLVRMNSREEYEYILSEIMQLGYEDIQFRVGGRRDVDGAGYYWVDEENNLYGQKLNDSGYWANSEWMQGEPSFVDGDITENCIDIYCYSDESRWVWNDVPDDIISVVPYYSGKIGYIVEYEE